MSLSEPFGAGVLFVEKHIKTLRLCVDYRRLNAQTIKDVYPTPRVEYAINDMKGARYFAKMDLSSPNYIKYASLPRTSTKRPSKPSVVHSNGW